MNQNKKNCRIYTVKVVNRKENSIYKVWEYSDENMINHFQNAKQRFFSITDIRGKIIHNIDIQSGWRYKMTLTWNPNKISKNGNKGDWQEFNRKKENTSPNNKNIQDKEIFQKLNVVYQPKDGKGAPIFNHNEMIDILSSAK